MTEREKYALQELQTTLHSIKEENSKFREDVSNQVKALANQITTKTLPISLEIDILKAVQQSMGESIKASLSSYDSPLKKLVVTVMNEYSAELKQLVSDSFSSVIRTEDFKQSIISAFSHKIARSIISNNDGLFDKVSNELKQDAIFKSKMAIAVSNVVEECLRGKE